MIHPARSLPHRFGLAALLALCLLCVPRGEAAGSATPPPARQIQFGRFGAVSVYLPQGPPKSVALFLSGDGGWNLGVIDMAQALVADGAVVAGLDIRRYLAAIGHSGGRCVSLAGDFEALSHGLQKRLGLHEYLVPVLVGYSSGATVVYATLAQSPSGTFAGALSLGFCADQDMKGAALCPAPSLSWTPNKHGDFVFAAAPRLKDPWIALQGQKDQVCEPRAVDEFARATAHGEVVQLPLVGHGFGVQRNWLPQFRAAYARLAGPAGHAVAAAVPTSPEVSDLPLTEVPAAAAPAPGGAAAADRDAFALLLTGDGGWAGLDQEVSSQLAARGMPVVGLNTLKYFWSARTPEQTARDVTRVLRHYLHEWKRERIVLVGYSFGADALPFVVNRLPADLRARIVSLNLIGLSHEADFEIHVADWIPGASTPGLPIAPELAKIGNLPLRCFYGEGESDTLCPSLPPHEAFQVGQGHHLGGRYEEIAARILAAP